MIEANTSKLRWAGLLGFAAVGLGALGAHGLETAWKAQLAPDIAARRLEVWATASHYHLAHAIVLLILAFVYPQAGQGRWTWSSFLFGILIFSGTLYALCLTGLNWLGAITPIGGLLLMLGWLLLALNSSRKLKS